MALNVCLEAVIRLFFEIIRVLFGDVTLLWRGGYFETQLPYLISTLKWVFVFTLLAMLVKNNLAQKLLIVGIPAAVNLLIDGLGLIPYVGTFLSTGAGIVGVPISALAWAFVLWTSEEVHPLLRVFATPGIMIVAAINAVQPLSIIGDMGYAVAFVYIAEIMAFLGVIFVGAVVGLSVYFETTFVCSMINWALVKWETIRYEGWGAAIFSCLVFIRNKVINVKYDLK